LRRRGDDAERENAVQNCCTEETEGDGRGARVAALSDSRLLSNCFARSLVSVVESSDAGEVLDAVASDARSRWRSEIGHCAPSVLEFLVVIVNAIIIVTS
jgi:hypothetical protein